MYSKPATLSLSIPNTDAVSVFKVSIPIDLLSFEVSLPLVAFLEGQVKSLHTLQSRRATSNAIPIGLLYNSAFVFAYTYLHVHD